MRREARIVAIHYGHTRRQDDDVVNSDGLKILVRRKFPGSIGCDREIVSPYKSLNRYLPYS